MRHHHRPHDLNRHSLSVLLDPSRPPTSVDSISGTSMDQTMIGMSEPITFDDDPIFVPHYEKVGIHNSENYLYLVVNNLEQRKRTQLNSF